MHTIQNSNSPRGSKDGSPRSPRYSVTQPGCERSKMLAPVTSWNQTQPVAFKTGRGKQARNFRNTAANTLQQANRRARYSNMTLDQAFDGVNKTVVLDPISTTVNPASPKDVKSLQSHSLMMASQRVNQLPPVAFDGLLKAAPNAAINAFEKKKKFQVCKGTFLT